jgi:hypothetical protein
MKRKKECGGLDVDKIELKLCLKTWDVSDVPSTPGMQVRKPWCLLSSNWVGLGNSKGGGDSD